MQLVAWNGKGFYCVQLVATCCMQPFLVTYAVQLVACNWLHEKLHSVCWPLSCIVSLVNKMFKEKLISHHAKMQVVSVDSKKE